VERALIEVVSETIRRHLLMTALVHDLGTAQLLYAFAECRLAGRRCACEAQILSQVAVYGDFVVGQGSQSHTQPCRPALHRRCLIVGRLHVQGHGKETDW